MKAVFYILIGFLVFAFFAQAMLSEYDKEIKINVIEQEEGEYLSNVQIKMYPQLPLKMEGQIAGKGTYVFATDKYKVVFMTVKKEGYKTKRFFKLLKEYETYDVYLEKEEKDE